MGNPINLFVKIRTSQIKVLKAHLKTAPRDIYSLINQFKIVQREKCCSSIRLCPCIRRVKEVNDC